MIDFKALVTCTLLGLASAAHAQPAPKTPAPAPAAPAAAAAVDANAVVDKVQKFYASIKQVTASFRQAVTNDTFGSTRTSDGTVWIKKPSPTAGTAAATAEPGKMRWDYLEKKKGKVEVKKSFISNGSTLYVVDHDNMQWMKKNLQSNVMPVAVTFLYGKGDLKAEFNAVLDTSGKYGAKGDHVLKLTPKTQSAQYQNLYLVVNASDYRVTQSVIIDSSNNVNHFRFYGPDFAKPVKDSWFEFDERSVKSYRMVDADQQQAAAGSKAAPAPAPAPVPPKKP